MWRELRGHRRRGYLWPTLNIRTSVNQCFLNNLSFCCSDIKLTLSPQSGSGTSIVSFSQRNSLQSCALRDSMYRSILEYCWDKQPVRTSGLLRSSSFEIFSPIYSSLIFIGYGITKPKTGGQERPVRTIRTRCRHQHLTQEGFFVTITILVATYPQDSTTHLTQLFLDGRSATNFCSQ